jgi:DNA topoisomerase VI subunit A
MRHFYDLSKAIIFGSDPFGDHIYKAYQSGFMLLEGCTSSRALCKEQFTAEHKPSEGRSFSG